MPFVVSVIDPQVAFNMLRLCSGFCKIVHLARSTPPGEAADSLKIMDSDVRSCFSKCFSIDLSEAAWCQSQLSLRLGGGEGWAYALSLSCCFYCIFLPSPDECS